MSDADRPAVLVIDDDTAVRHTLAAMVEQIGYAARIAASGDEGLREYDRHRDRIAAVLLDVQMPGMDGPQTLAELRVRNPSVPCVFVTGHSPNYSQDELAGWGATVLSKPITLDQLGRAIRAATGRE